MSPDGVQPEGQGCLLPSQRRLLLGSGGLVFVFAGLGVWTFKEEMLPISARCFDWSLAG